VTEYRQYENGVADVLAFLLGDDAAVDRNVRIRGNLSKALRQIDVRVRGRLYGRKNATLIVDCKRWGNKIDVADVGTFIDLVKDGGADFGLLVTTVGASRAARERARAETTVHIEVMTLGELKSWSPPGTVFVKYRLPLNHQEAAERALRRAGFRATLATDLPTADDEVVLEAFRHYGVANPHGEIQAEHTQTAQRALAAAGIQAHEASHGVTISGGTPGSRWLEVALDGTPVGLKVLAATDDEANRQLDHVAASSGAHRAALSVIKPHGWPITGLFDASSLRQAEQAAPTPH
jgi:restriction endonuclease